MGRGSLGQGSMSANRGSLISTVSSVGKPSTSTLASVAAGLLSETTSLKDLAREAGNNNNSCSTSIFTTTSFSYVTSSNSGVSSCNNVNVPNNSVHCSLNGSHKKSKGKGEPVLQRVRVSHGFVP